MIFEGKTNQNSFFDIHNRGDSLIRDDLLEFGKGEMVASNVR